MANNLPFDRQVEVISALIEGVSIRATERLTGVHRYMQLGVRVGMGCDKLRNAVWRPDNPAGNRVQKDGGRAEFREPDEVGLQALRRRTSLAT